MQSKEKDLRSCCFTLTSARWLLLACLPLLSQCSGTTKSYQNTLSYVLFPAPDHQLSRAELAKRPYDTLYAKVGDLPQAVLVLAYDEHGQQKWLSADRALLILQQGRLVKTTGFNLDLVFSARQGIDPLSKPLAQIQVGDHFERVLDWSAAQHTNQLQKLSIISIEAASLELLQQQFDAVLVQEQVTFADQSTAINQFWFERRSGRLLQSQQQAAAFAPVMKLTHISSALRLLPVEVQSAS